MNGMCDTKGWDAQGRETPCQNRNNNDKDCAICIDVFEQTQGQVELLRVQLKAALDADNPLSIEALRRAIIAAMPTRQPVAGVPGHEEYQRGWNACLDVMESHLDALLSHP